MHLKHILTLFRLRIPNEIVKVLKLSLSKCTGQDCLFFADCTRLLFIRND